MRFRLPRLSESRYCSGWSGSSRLQNTVQNTRAPLGLNSRVVITGDKTQIDLPRREDSGLLQVERILHGIDGIALIYLTGKDVIRHRLVKDIIRAYARDEGADEG